MNDKFFSLPEEKQQNIINAAMEVFACHDYKHASTDLIASKAGISKGLLFYYFHNKKELYLYLYDYIKELLMKEVVDQKESVSDALQDANFKQQDDLFVQFCSNIDREKFKEAAEPHTIYKMLVWMTDGYLHELRMINQPLNVDELMKEFHCWCHMLKQLVYKEEYI